jgi:hypothetical protein
MTSTSSLLWRTWRDWRKEVDAPYRTSLRNLPGRSGATSPVAPMLPPQQFGTSFTRRGSVAYSRAHPMVYPEASSPRRLTRCSPVMVTPDPEWARAWEYARCTVQLQDDLEAAGAEALFDHALSNGLTAIVSAEWPGDELRKDGKIKSAVDLLAVVEAKPPQVTPGVFRLPYADPNGNGEILVAAGVLRGAVTMTQPIRHARPSQGTRLLAAHVEALVALDEHPALRHLADEHSTICGDTTPAPIDSRNRERPGTWSSYRSKRLGNGSAASTRHPSTSSYHLIRRRDTGAREHRSVPCATRIPSW